MNLNRTDDWHLHLTVVPRSDAVAKEYVFTCSRVNAQATVIENLPGSAPAGLIRPEQELIPTIKMHGELGQALILLHDAAKVFAVMGWLVPRLKIEGREQSPDALYAETHLLLRGVGPESRSVTSGKMYSTLRSRDASPNALSVLDSRLQVRGIVGAKLEWTIYDSNRELDRPWFKSWGMEP